MGNRDQGLGTRVRSSQSKLVSFKQSLRSKSPVPSPQYLVPFFFILSVFCLLSCGLEEYLYIDYIPDGTITDVTSARLQLPSSSAEGYNYFSRFIIYYRIYISGEGMSGEITSSTLRNQINSSLNSDFVSLYNLTDKTSTSANPSNLDTTFDNRKYFKLTLEEGNIDSVLGSGALGKSLEIQFFPNIGFKPVLVLGGNTYTLRRAVSGPGTVFYPQPEDRYFLNHPDLYNIENVRNDINADVATNTQTSTEMRYTYVSMYIFAMGQDFITTIYSQPTHIGIFRLAEAF